MCIRDRTEVAPLSVGFGSSAAVAAVAAAAAGDAAAAAAAAAAAVHPLPGHRDRAVALPTITGM